MKFGKKLANLREEKGLTQEELAGEFQVSRQTISDWESDKVDIDDETVAKICRCFNVDINYLCDDEDRETQAEPVCVDDNTKAQNAKSALAIWRVSVAISVILFAMFCTLTVVVVSMLVNNKVAMPVLLIAGLVLSGLATLMALVMLIISSVMFVRSKKSLATEKSNI